MLRAVQTGPRHERLTKTARCLIPIKCHSSHQADTGLPSRPLAIGDTHSGCPLCAHCSHVGSLRDPTPPSSQTTQLDGSGSIVLQKAGVSKENAAAPHGVLPVSSWQAPQSCRRVLAATYSTGSAVSSPERLAVPPPARLASKTSGRQRHCLLKRLRGSPVQHCMCCASQGVSPTTRGQRRAALHRSVTGNPSVADKRPPSGQRSQPA